MYVCIKCSKPSRTILLRPKGSKRGYLLQVSLYGKGWGFEELKYIYERFAKSTIDMFKWTIR